MDTNTLKRDRELEILSGTKEVVNPNKKEIIKNIEDNKDKAISHGKSFSENPKESEKFKYHDGNYGPSSD